MAYVISSRVKEKAREAEPHGLELVICYLIVPFRQHTTSYKKISKPYENTTCLSADAVSSSAPIDHRPCCSG
jgi:hypothetical protein